MSPVNVEFASAPATNSLRMNRVPLVLPMVKVALPASTELNWRLPLIFGAVSVVG